ncbi:MAG: SDR family NAD(P)-dependent oxidoreductase [Desulfomonile tiedjei]|nr:SDR family NAD(P)-dependent oxidoreductase [Desulfomonile tiedjei]
MSVSSEFPLIAFVWRYGDIASSVVDAARSTGTLAIFDVSEYKLNEASRALLQADADGRSVGLKISPEALLDDTLQELVDETGITTFFTELHPLLLNGDVDRYLGRIGELSGEVTIVPIVGDVGLIQHILLSRPDIGRLALKGSEAAGLVSTETTFTLYSAVREMLVSREEPMELTIWGGVATPEAAAAFLAAGAGGLVFESVHWLTDLVGLSAEQHKRIANLRPDHTDLNGLNLQVPCRLFNKGNSKSVKELRAFAGSLCGAEIRDEQRRFFANRINKEAVAPLDSTFSRDELIPLGVDAAFAASFVRRFGSSTRDAIHRFVQAVEDCCAAAPARAAAFASSPVARDMGTRYPFIQGAMSSITDVPEFAKRVADAGGLPTVALGVMGPDVLADKLGRLGEVMESRPYAVNVITLQENPQRQAQLQWIRANRPRFAVIAAGEPSHAKELQADGIDTVYIAPNEELLKLALDAGIRYVICEGHEAGGHVGQHSSLTMAQIVIDLKDREPSLFNACSVILAGGIFNRETAFMAAMLGADAIQTGTGYLSTAEIVETGALTGLYQRMILDARLGGTVVTGEGTGLRVRSLRTSRIEAICSLERDFAAGSHDEGAFRRKIEELSAGSLFVAARGLDRPGGSPLDEQECMDYGQFMSGACAAAINSVRTIADYHRALAEAPLAVGLPFVGPIVDRPAARVRPEELAVSPASGVVGRTGHAGPQPERIAITGMSVVNALGNSPEEVWAACLAGKSGIIAVPHTRWDHAEFYHPRVRMSEKTYCKVGAFQNIEVSRKDIGIPPQDFRTMTNSTKITMWLATKAVEESGILESDIPRERIAVLISQNSGEAAATLQDVIIRGELSKIVSAMKKVVNLSAEAEHAVEEQIKAGRIVIDDTTLLGRLNCSAAGFICNKYGFMGPSFSVSAACATSLVAMYSAYQMIRNGIIDAAVIGGAEEFLTPMHFLEFSALGALAGLAGIERPPTQASRPFDMDRDGMVLGEGGGVIIIERESLARKRGAKVHSYITSMGASNNHLGMVESSRITQEIAIRESFRDASYGPEGVDLIECHATSTRQGDVEEVQALKSFYNSGKGTVLTSFKSQIGHTLGASGINSLVRGVMAMKAGLFPATLNYETPDPEIGIEGSGFTVHRGPAEWPQRNGRPRRLEVNAFGFGGSNYVVQVEQALDDDAAVTVSPPQVHRAVEGPSDAAPVEGISFFRTTIGGASYRLGVVAANEGQAIEMVQACEPFANDGAIAPKRLRALARQGIHLGVESEAPSPLAFVFPGQGSHYAGMGHELYQTFPIVREWMDRAANVAEFDLLQLLFHDSEEDLQKTRWQQPALFTMEFAMVKHLMSLGVRPTAVAGHSLGELTALCVAGVYSFEDGFRIVNKRAICMDKACENNVDPGVMMAVDAPMDFIEEALQRVENVYITNLNSPHQVVLGGNTETVKALGAELKQHGHRSKLLRVSMAFHSPIMRCIHDELEEFIAGVRFHPPQIPVISNTTKEPFPAEEAEIKKIVMAHLESPVYWMENALTLWNDYGVRVFVEVGPRDILSNLIADSIEEAHCVQTCLPSAEELIYRTALAQLFARGNLPVRSSLKFVSFPTTAKAPEPYAPASAMTSATSAPGPQGTVERVIQREINSFVMESFGRFLKPNLLAAIRREYDPGCTVEKLDSLLKTMFPTAAVPAGPIPIAAPEAVLPQSLVQPVVAGGAPVQAVKVDDVSTPADSETGDLTETVIRIIMDATGYERNEIEPDMDLREDLSIRSSRLPVIMDALEAQFAVKIELEEFMDARTIRDISERLAKLVKKVDARPAANKATQSPARRPLPAEPAASRERQPIKRVVFREVPLEPGSFQPVELDPLESVAILSAVGGTGLRKAVGDVFRRDYGVGLAPVAFLGDGSGREDGAFDLRTEEGRTLAVRQLEEIGSLAGLAFILDDALAEKLETVDDVSAILKGFFGILKAFAESSSRKFAICLHRTDHANGLGRLLSEGLLGMFLSMAQEFSSVQFRTVRLDSKTNLRDAIRGSLDRSQKVLETVYKGGSLFTRRGLVVPLPFGEPEPAALTADDVVVFSGGAYGITPELARSLVPYGCRMVFLGRTAPDPNVDYDRIPDDPVLAEQAASKLLAQAPPLAAGEQGRKIAEIVRGAEIFRTINGLRSAGIDASYHSCNVTDSRATQAAVEEIVKKYGKIDGIVHSAGLLRDSFLKQMSSEDFSAVVNVKFLGAWNLFNAAEKVGLRFMACLSSAASIQGNPGQVNYAAGNRIMSALLTHLRRTHRSIRFKALILPPIEGAGMAENEEIRSLMKRMNAEYVHVRELAGLFCRELFVAPADDVWVMLMRSLPDVPTVKLDQSEVLPFPGRLHAGGVVFNGEEFPMIDAVSRIDMSEGLLEVARTFSHERDLWINDHKPFKIMKDPIVSAIMVVETFLEAGRLLYPHLTALGIRNAQFLDIIECPPGSPRQTEILCRRLESPGLEVVCEVSLAARELSPTGRVVEPKLANYRALVVLGGGPGRGFREPHDLRVTREELESRPMNRSEALKWYDNRTDLKGRYRVVQEMYGSASGAVMGRIQYAETADFAPPAKTHYQYPPYLLEGLMQVVNFYIIMRDPNEKRSMIPFGIGEMAFSRKCSPGEAITVEARIRHQTEEGITWDARAADKNGQTIMYAKDLVMRWFPK